MKLQLIRNATLKLDYAGHTLLIDPYFADKLTLRSFAGRSKNPTVDLPINPAEIAADVELVLVSHLHTDHFDQPAQDALDKQLPLFCQPDDVAHIAAQGFTNVIGLEDVVEWKGIRLTRTAGRHGSSDAVLQMMGRVMGFVLQAEGEPTIYFASDSVWYPAIAEEITRHQPDVIVTHSCGAQWGDNELIIMDAAQTIVVCQHAPESVVVAVHMEALDHGTVSRAQLRDAADAAGISAEKLLIPADGETLTL